MSSVEIASPNAVEMDQIETAHHAAACATASGKLILLGEHAVVYGGSALGTSISQGVAMRAYPAEVSSLSIPAWNVELESTQTNQQPDTKSPPKLVQAYTSLLKRLQLTRAWRVEASVHLGSARGLGCSAALGVALTRVLMRAEQPEQTANNLEVVQAAMVWEKVFHGNPSGLDIALASQTGVLRFRPKGSRSEPILEDCDLKQPLFLVVAMSDRTSSTKDMVEKLARKRDRNPLAFNKWLATVESLVETGHRSLEQNAHPKLGWALDRNHESLCSMNLSTPHLDELCAQARLAGALGAKLTGAGGGGCIIALAEDTQTSEVIANRLTELTYRTEHPEPNVFQVAVMPKHV